MINLVFFNSYQNSPIGFQSSQYLLGSKELMVDGEGFSKLTETEKLLTNSGCSCALGKTEKGQKQYFVYRGLCACNENGINWYINFGIESDEKSSEIFYNLITDLLLDFNSFKNSLKNWFIATPDDSFSYNLNFDYIDRYFSEEKKISIDDIEFYGISNPYIDRFKKMLLNMRKSTSDSLVLLVPETTLNYFNNQNQFFKNIEKQCVIEAKAFEGLLEHNEADIEFQHEEKKINNNNRDTASKPENSIVELIEENKNTIIKVCKITALTLAIVGSGVLLKKFLGDD